MGKGFNNPEPGGSGGKTDTWLTPKEVIDALGPFDLDPCAAPTPRPWDCAVTNYIEEDDGLNRYWPKSEFVFCNPPYNRTTGQFGAFLAKLSGQGNGIAFIFARTETKVFQSAANMADVIFFPEGRYKFCLPDGTPAKGNAGAPSVFLGYGPLALERLKGYNKTRRGLLWIK